jgi:hydrogenase/urease accessory protein HupE
VRRLVAALLLCAAFAAEARAHDERPAYLELRERSLDTYDVLWKVPARGGDLRLGIYVRFPADAVPLGEPRGLSAGGAWIERWSIRRAGGLAGQVIAIDGLSATAGTDVLVRLERADGSTQVTRLLPTRPSFVVEAAGTFWSVAATYLALGVEHIWSGIDHLLFVLALLLLVKGWRRLVGTITAFTMAHCLTLAAATLGFVHVPGPPVEACIALSILLVATEIVHARRGRAGLTERAPWLVAFTFGLLHGLGFAGALSEVGLPPTAIPAALLSFNVGVELGQLAFIAAVLGVAALGRTLARRLTLRPPAWAGAVPAYSIGGVAAFWFLQRVAAF